MKQILSTAILVLIMASGCKKENTAARATEVCYQCKDFNGNDLNRICAPTEDSAYNVAKNACINGNCSPTKQEFLSNCPLQQ